MDPEKAPANWDELTAAITKIYKKEGDRITRLGFWYGNSSLVWWLVPFWQQGGELTSADETKSTFNDERMVRAFELTMRFLDMQGGLDEMNKFRGDAAVQVLFSTGKCGMWTDVMNITRFEQFKDNFAKIKVGVNTYPVAPGGKPAAYRGGGAHLLVSGAKNPDGGFAFLEWLFEKPNDLRFNDVRDSIPARKSVANSEEYIKGDPLRRQGAREMNGAKWVVSAPGGRAIIGLHVEAQNNIWQKKKTIQEQLKETDQKVQQALDDALKSSVIKF